MLGQISCPRLFIGSIQGLGFAVAKRRQLVQQFTVAGSEGIAPFPQVLGRGKGSAGGGEAALSQLGYQRSI